MAGVIKVYKQGGPEVLTYEEVAVPPPGPGEVTIKQSACGLNFTEIYFRSGLYPVPSMPYIPGSEGAGRISAVGAGVTDLKVGDRVAYYFNLGGYSTERNLPAERVVRLPDGISEDQGAVLMLKGLTVQYLIRQIHRVRPGDTILLHAAAGGIGVILSQWARSLGAVVIGTVGSREKAKIAKANGCDHVIVYSEENFVDRVKEITGGKLCDVVYDGVGKSTFPGSLDCLRRRGLFVTFGNASGPVPPFQPLELSRRGSLSMVRPTLFDYTATRPELLAATYDLFGLVLDGTLKVEISKAYALKDAATAHRELESRLTVGPMILRP